MTNKEIGELRRRMKPDRTNLTAVYGCYVASSGEVLSTFREPFGLMAEEDKEKYLAIFRRALSGTPDRNLLDLSFSTKQVADSDEHRLLMRLRETALDDEQARQQLFQTIIGAVSFEENYLILLAHERYDVPFKARDGARLEDGSEVFSYFVCAICPVKPGKELLSYIAEEKTFHNRSAGWAAGMPEMGFLFPAFDGRRTNLYNCLFYTHSSGADNQPLIDALFHVQPPMPADCCAMRWMRNARWPSCSRSGRNSRTGSTPGRRPKATIRWSSAATSSRTCWKAAACRRISGCSSARSLTSPSAAARCSIPGI